MGAAHARRTDIARGGAAARTRISVTGLWVRHRTIWLKSSVGTNGPYSHGADPYPTQNTVSLAGRCAGEDTCNAPKWAQNARAPMCSNSSAVAGICPDSYPARILIRRGFLSDMAWPESSQLSELARAVPNVVCLPGLRCQKRPYVERDSALRIQKSVGRKSLRMGGLSCLLAPNLSPPLFLAYVPGVAPLPARTSTPGRSLLSLFGCLL
jgi:hypothetical protein